MATFASIIVASIGDVSIMAPVTNNNIVVLSFKALFSVKSFLLLKYVLCIYHLVLFKITQAQTGVLINFDSKVNAIILAYTKWLGFWI